MQSYILILLGILVVLLIGVIYFGYRKIINLEIENSRNKYDIEALRGLLSRILEGDDSPPPNNIQQFPGKQMMNAQELGNMQNIINNNFSKQGFEQKVNPQFNFMPGPPPFSKGQSFPMKEDLESDVETLESSDDEVPNNEESSVSIESLGTSESDTEETESEETTSSEETKTESSTESEESEETDDEEAEKLMQQELEIDDEDDEEKLMQKELDIDDDEEEAEKLLEEELNVKEVVETKEEKVEEEQTVEEDVKEVNVGETKKGRKNVPNESAKDFKIGHKLKSTNDGKFYEVIMSGKTKRWKLV